MLGIVLKKRVIVSWVVLLMAVAAIGLLAWSWVSGECYRQYTKAQMLIEDAVDDYRAAHSDTLPVLGNASVLLEKPAGTYSVIDMCSLVGAGKGFEAVPDGCAEVGGDGNDNCDGGDCSCNSTHHYVWLVDSGGEVLSKCLGPECGYNNEDGYQGIWP